MDWEFESIAVNGGGPIDGLGEGEVLVLSTLVSSLEYGGYIWVNA